MKKLNYALTSILCITVLTACGGQTDVANQNTTDSIESSTNAEIETKSGDSTQKQYTLSETFNKDSDYIWYYLQYPNKGKDALIKYAYTYDNGEFIQFKVDGNIKLGDFAKLSDEEILEELYANYTSNTNAKNEEIIESYTNQIHEYAQDVNKYIELIDSDEEAFEKSQEYFGYDVFTSFETLKEDLKNVAEKLSTWSADGITSEPVSAKIGILTDSTGNNVEQMTIHIEDKSEIDFHKRCIFKLGESISEVNQYSLEYESGNTNLFTFWGDFYEDELYGYQLSEVLQHDDIIVKARNIDRSYDFYLSSSLRAHIEIYDSFYNGYDIPEDGAAFVTRCNLGDEFIFDTFGTAGVEIDPNWNGIDGDIAVEEVVTPW